MIMMTQLTVAVTVLSALAAAVMLGLVVYGFRRYINRPRSAPIDYIGTGIALMAATKLLRLLWWDVIPHTFLAGLTEFRFSGHQVNWIFDAGVIWSCWFMLKGIFIMVDSKDPGKYNVFTAVFYPKRLRMWIISKEEE